MLELELGRVEGVDGLRLALQGAVELEHATIPPYLTALYSVKTGTNRDVAAILRSVVTEEMLHMALACNLLNAIGGEPVIDKPGFLPCYPGALPMCIGSDDGSHFVVALAPLSRQLVHDVFMHIEEPEDPIDLPADAGQPPPHHRTIGQFYRAVAHEIRRQGDAIFTGDPGRQLTSGLSDGLVRVTDVASALRAIGLILSQGEGSSTSPLDVEGEAAHYYRFAEIWHGRAIAKDPSVPDGYAFTGAPVTLDEHGIWPLVSDPTLERYRHDPTAWAAAQACNVTYSLLLRQLHDVFAGAPDGIQAAIDTMFAFKRQARALVALPVAGLRQNAAPTFEYVAPD